MIPKINKILYATDLSPNSAYAFRYAVNSAEKHKAKITILHAFEINTKALMTPYLTVKELKKIYDDERDYTPVRIRKRLR